MISSIRRESPKRYISIFETLADSELLQKQEVAAIKKDNSELKEVGRSLLVSVEDLNAGYWLKI